MGKSVVSPVVLAAAMTPQMSTARRPMSGPMRAGSWNSSIARAVYAPVGHDLAADPRDGAGVDNIVFTEIKHCRICGNANLVSVLDLGEQHLTGVFPSSQSHRVGRGPIREKCDRRSGPRSSC